MYFTPVDTVLRLSKNTVVEGHDNISCITVKSLLLLKPHTNLCVPTSYRISPTCFNRLRTNRKRSSEDVKVEVTTKRNLNEHNGVAMDPIMNGRYKGKIITVPFLVHISFTFL